MIEGDIAGSIDAERMEALGVPVVQINTEGACHLDAGMIAAAAGDLLPSPVGEGAGDRVPSPVFGRGVGGEGQPPARLLVIENVGNLVCTAGFDLGERLRIVVLSVSEGDDKLVKYPAIFQSSQALVVSKIDLLPHTNFRLERVAGDMKRLGPTAAIFPVSALHGDGIPALADWLLARASGFRSPLPLGEG